LFHRVSTGAGTQAVWRYDNPFLPDGPAKTFCINSSANPTSRIFRVAAKFSINTSTSFQVLVLAGSCPVSNFMGLVLARTRLSDHQLLSTSIEIVVIPIDGSAFFLDASFLASLI
jgi:hypothetical protein